MKYFTELTAFAAGMILASIMMAPAPSFEQSFEGTKTAETNIAAVSNQGSGSLGSVNVKIGPGDGSTLLNADPFIQTDTQVSAKTSKRIAEEFTNQTLTDKDITYRFSIDGEYVGGPSAGAAMSLATIAAIEDKQVPEDIAVTGTIRGDGTIGKVGGILEKARAAGRNDLEVFYVPPGQANITYYTRNVDRNEFYPGVYSSDIEYEKNVFSINNYTMERFNMSTKEVASIEELYRKVSE